MKTNRLPYYKHELIKMIPGFILLALIVFWGRLMPSIRALDGIQGFEIRLDRLFRMDISENLLFSFVALAALVTAFSLYEEKNRRMIKNCAMLPLTGSDRFLVKSFSYMTGVFIIYLLFTISVLVIFMTKDIAFTGFTNFLKTAARDILWILFIFYVFMIFHGISGNIMSALAMGALFFVIYSVSKGFMIRPSMIFYVTTSPSSPYYFINNIIDLTGIPFGQLVIKLSIITIISAVISYFLYKSFKNEKAGLMFRNSLYEAIFKVIFTFYVYIFLLQEVTGVFFMNSFMTLNFFTHMSVSLFLVSSSYMVSHIITRIGQTGLLKHTRKQMITAVLVCVSFSVIIAVGNTYFSQPKYIRTFEKMMKQETLYTDSLLLDNSSFLTFNDLNYTYTFKDNELIIVYDTEMDPTEAFYSNQDIWSSSIHMFRAALLFTIHEDVDTITFDVKPYDEDTIRSTSFNKNLMVEILPALDLPFIKSNITYNDWYELYQEYAHTVRIRKVDNK